MEGRDRDASQAPRRPGRRPGDGERARAAERRSVGGAQARRQATSMRTSSSAAAARSGGFRCGVASRPPRSPSIESGRSSGPVSTGARRPRGPPLVSRYRYPETPRGIGVTTTLRGPERVFRLRIAKRVANVGVVVTQLGEGATSSRGSSRDSTRTDSRGTPGCRSTGIRTWTTSASRCPRPACSHRCRASTPSSSTAQPRRRGCVHVPLLGQRRDATRPAAAARRASSPVSPSSCRRRMPGAGRPPRRSGSRRRLVQERNPPRRRPLDLDGRPVDRDASPAPAGLRLPGVEEHGERRAHPPQHAHGHVHVPRSLVAIKSAARRPAVKTTRPRSGRSVLAIADPRERIRDLRAIYAAAGSGTTGRDGRLQILAIADPRERIRDLRAMRRPAVGTTRPRSGRLQGSSRSRIRASGFAICGQSTRRPAVGTTRPRSGRLQGSSRSRIRASGFAICGQARSCCRAPRSSGARRGRRWTERMNSSFSSSGATTRSCFLRFWRSRSRRAAAPKRASRRGFSTATARAAARTSNRSHGQLTVGFYAKLCAARNLRSHIPGARRSLKRSLAAAIASHR